MAAVDVSLLGPTRWATLTTDHPMSAHGQPVLVDGEAAYGPDDLILIDGIAKYTAREQVLTALRRETAMPERGMAERGWLRPATADAIALVERFVGPMDG